MGAAIFCHRWLGLALCLLFTLWFASGIVMMYWGFPEIGAGERLRRAESLKPEAIRVSPEAAYQRLQQAQPPDAARLTMLDSRPVYRFRIGRSEAMVFAGTGEPLFSVHADMPARIAAAWMGRPASSAQFEGALNDVDQWTVSGEYNAFRPLLKYSWPDGDEVYVSALTGEVVQHTTRVSRLAAYFGAIPHWLYWTPLRKNGAAWSKVVIWSSGIGTMIALLGLIVGVSIFSPRRRVPYQGQKRWHMILGLSFGVLAATWAFSGLLSMEPFAWTRAQGLEAPRDAFTGGPLDLAQFAALDPAAWDQLLAGRAVKEVELVRIQGEHYYLVRGAPDEPAAAQQRERLHQPYNVAGRVEAGRLLINAKTLEPRSEPFSVDSLMARLREALPGVPIVEQQLLQDYDSYYYSRGRQAPLPVLRVKFGDPAETWLYIDPEMSRVVAEVHRLSRVERWLYSGLHDLDFAFWYDRRPLWDIGVIALLLGGLASSGIGLYLGMRRLWRVL
jgi:uncharacterized membrane protein